MSDWKKYRVTRTYEVNGRRYKFEVRLIDDGILYGYCSKLGKYAWLYDTYFWIDGGTLTPATLVAQTD